MAAFYTTDAEGSTFTPIQISQEMDSHNWTHGWRMQDIDKVIWYGGCFDQCEFQQLPYFFILNTSTMRIEHHQIEGVDAMIDAIVAIDNAHK